MPASFAPMVEYDGLGDAVSGLPLGCNRLVRQADNPQSRNRQQSSDENWRRDTALCLDLKMRSERVPVGLFTLDTRPACLIILLLPRSFDDGTDQAFADFESTVPCLRFRDLRASRS
jgi:hypothetical protein